jgi:hypothetical protein
MLNPRHATRLAVWELANYASGVSRRIDDDGLPDPLPPSVVDVHFFKVAVDERLDKTKFDQLLEAAMASPGEFSDIDRDRMGAGPSYIELGSWIGDQGRALVTMAVGQVAGRWNVITPGLLGLTGPAADEAAGAGYVMVTGLRDR